MKDGLVCFLGIVDESVVEIGDIDSESESVSKRQGEGRA